MAIAGCMAIVGGTVTMEGMDTTVAMAAAFTVDMPPEAATVAGSMAEAAGIASSGSRCAIYSGPQRGPLLT
jgi:hypothetical protein